MKKFELKIFLSIYVILAVLTLTVPVVFQLTFTFLREDIFTLPFDIITAVGLFCLLALLIIEIVARFVNKDAQWQSLAITIGLFLMALSSNDALRLFSSMTEIATISYGVKAALTVGHYSCFGIVMVFYASFALNMYFKKADPRIFTSITFFLVIIAVSMVIFYFFDLQIIPFAVCVLGVLVFQSITIGLAYKRKQLSLDMVALYIIILLVCMLEFSQVVEHSNFKVFFWGGVSSVLSIFIFVHYLLIYLDFTSKITHKARQKEESDRRVNELQANILKNQVDPHFIFNALNVIKSLYRTEPDKGEKALDLLSKNLRAYTRAATQKLVPLEAELQIVSDYVELESMKYSKPIEVIYDIEDYDFEVPVFSLEPLIENACRYSGVPTMEDGFIEIRTAEVDGGHLISVADNGKGFDSAKVGTDSYGIRNVKERFEILLKAKVTVESEVGKGAKITIFIPEGEEERV